MSSDADPRGSWAFRRRVALARAAGGFETIWSAAWPSLMVVGAFLVVSLLGLWAALPAWLHALGLLAFLAASGCGRRGGRAMPGAGRTTAPGCGVWSRSTSCRTSPCARSATGFPAAPQDPATQMLWRRHLERLRQAVRGLQVGPPRSDLPRRDPWALRVAIVLLLVVALVEAGNMAPKRLVQAFELERGAGDAWLPARDHGVDHAADLHRTTAAAPRAAARPWPTDEAIPAPVQVSRPGRQRGARAAASFPGRGRPASRSPSTRSSRPSRAIGEDSAEATLTIERSGELTITGPGERLHAWTIEAIPGHDARDRLRRGAGGHAPRRSALALPGERRLRPDQHRPAAEPARRRRWSRSGSS